jgi:hypothetical protein
MGPQEEIYLHKSAAGNSWRTFQPQGSLPSMKSKVAEVGEVGSKGTSVTSLSISLSEASSATNDVVTFRRGRLNILETRLKIEMETPTAPCSTGPGGAKHLKLDHRSHQNCLRFSKTMNITKRRENQELSKDQQLLNFQHQ